MDIANQIVTLVAGLATALAAVFAGWQVLQLRRDRRQTDAMERHGVAVSWQTKSKPRTPESDGWATWVYEVTAHNPGRLPIRNVDVLMTFPRAVRRKHHDGHLSDPSAELDLGIAVLVGGASKAWTRTLRMPFDEHASLRGITAQIRFVDMAGKTVTNTWAATAHS